MKFVEILYNDIVYRFKGVTIVDNFVYLDNSSTTMPCKSAIDKINIALSENWANPSSLYRKGLDAQMAVDSARKNLADLICSREDEVYFTSCGTESNNTAIVCGALKGKKRGNRIVTTSIEHPSVLETVKRFEAEGFEIIRIKPDKQGKISSNDLYRAINDKTILVSVMLVNNETGAIMPVRSAADAIKAAGAPALLHCDAVQAFGKMPINVRELGVDMLSISGHKIHGPKGIGALYIRKGVTLKPFITGGGQERGMRSGTESVPLICGLDGAMEDMRIDLKKQRELWQYTRDILTQIDFVKVNSPDDCLPYILNVSVNGYRSETLLHFLESKNIFVSSGSACAKGNGSYVLSEMGLDKKRVDSAIRISFSRYNTKEDADRLRDALLEATKKLRRAN